MFPERFSPTVRIVSAQFQDIEDRSDPGPACLKTVRIHLAAL